jgi:hypothetical protein
MYALFARQGTDAGASTASSAGPRLPGASPALHRRVRVHLGRWSMMGVDMPGANVRLPPGIDVSIGAPLLAFADVRMDFAKPSLCVGPKPSVKDGLVFAYRDRRDKSATKDPVATLLRILEDFLTQIGPPGSGHQAGAARAQ